MKKTIYVVGYEANPETGGISGYEYCFTQDGADIYLAEIKNDISFNDSLLYWGNFELEVSSEDYNVFNDVENYLMEVGFELGFPNNQRLPLIP